MAHNLNVLDVREVAAALVGAVEQRHYAEPLLLSGHNISAQMLFHWICEIGQTPPPPLSAPAWLTALGSYVVETAFSAVGMEAPFNSLAAILSYNHEWLPPSTALRELGVAVRPLYETLQDSVNWYRSIGYC
jgi:hypothetical protein